MEELEDIFRKDIQKFCMIEKKSATGARDNLGRLTTILQENKRAFKEEMYSGWKE